MKYCCHCKDPSAEPDSAAARPSSNTSCTALTRVATWLLSGVSAAFFASLEQCSCVRVATKEVDTDGGGSPLVCNIGLPESDVINTAGRGEEDCIVEVDYDDN